MVAVLLGAGSALLIGWLMVGRLPVPHDTTWFLHVLRRVRAGNALYRDVFFGAGPLPVWVAGAAIALMGDDVRTLRRLHVLVQAATTCGLLLVVDATGGAAAAALLAAPLVAFSGLVWPGDNAYGQLSRLGAAVTAAALVLGDAGTGALVVAAAGAAIACLAKYTLGAVTVGVAIASTAGSHGVQAALVLLGLTTAALSAAVTVLARRRLLHAFVHRAVRNKRTFVATGTVRPLEGLRPHLTGGWSRAGLHDRAVVTGFGLLALAPLTTVVAALVAVLDSTRRHEAAAVALLAAVALASALPRTDHQHVLGASPLAVAAVAALASWAPRGVELVVDGSLATVGVLGLAAAVAHWRGRGRAPLSVRAPWKGVPGPELPEALLAAGEELQILTGGEVFLLRPDAATWYLACGLTNPTPYDYPLASTFGPDGQQVVAADLRSGRVPWCCFSPADAGPLTPTVLEAMVQRELVPVRQTALGMLYQSPASVEG